VSHVAATVVIVVAVVAVVAVDVAVPLAGR
jgi:hypothetical protein